MKDKFDELFEQLKEITGVQDIGYHCIRNDKLNPINKSKSGEVSLERWKAVHKESPVYIKDNSVLQEIVENKKTVIISDVKSDPRSSKEFFLFGLDSLLVIPVLNGELVEGIVPIVSVGKVHDFKQEEVTKCEKVVDKFTEFLINSSI